MKSFLDTIFFRSNNLDYVSQNIKDLTKNTPANKIFDAINSFSSDSEIRYVGGCVRKIINKEKVDDIDLATNLDPQKVCEALKENKINYYETGIEHGTITAIIDEYKFEITTLREDISTDGRHAKVQFSKDWKEDASRRDFTINSIYSDREGNLFDPFDGRKDLENGLVKFIGNSDIRIKEDYLRILRYLRFFTNYSKHPHNPELIRKLKMNIGGISKLSKERLFDELKKISQLENLEKIAKNKISLELLQIIFPELKNIIIFSKLNSYKRSILEENDFIFMLSLMIIDDSDNTDYFFYKFNISKKDQKRLKLINLFYKEKITIKNFTEKNFNKIFYFNGKQAVCDIINFKLFTSSKVEKKLIKLMKTYQDKVIPAMPVEANLLMNKYNIPEGKTLGSKLKMIEEIWVSNNFNISDKQVEKIAKS
jgi:poly(A) polymerase